MCGGAYVIMVRMMSVLCGLGRRRSAEERQVKVCVGGRVEGGCEEEEEREEERCSAARRRWCLHEDISDGEREVR